VKSKDIGDMHSLKCLGGSSIGMKQSRNSVCKHTHLVRIHESAQEEDTEILPECKENRMDLETICNDEDAGRALLSLAFAT
jgi:hypothetical protein